MILYDFGHPENPPQKPSSHFPLRFNVSAPLRMKLWNHCIWSGGFLYFCRNSGWHIFVLDHENSIVHLFIYIYIYIYCIWYWSTSNICAYIYIQIYIHIYIYMHIYLFVKENAIYRKWYVYIYMWKSCTDYKQQIFRSNDHISPRDRPW